MNYYLCVTSILLSVVRSSVTVYQLSDDEYSRLPPVVYVAPWSACLRPPGGLYCVASITYVADGNNALLTMMQKISEDTSSRVNHTRAFYGTCLSDKCKYNDNNTISDPRTLLEQCLNHTVWEEYKLRVKVEEKVICHEHGENKPVPGPGGIAIAGLLLAFVILNIVGSLLDILCPTRWTGWMDRLAGKIFLCFSISRNWKKLIAPPGDSDPRLENFKGIHGIRALSMSLVVITHTLQSSILIYENPKFAEDAYDSLYLHMFLNGTIIMQTFFFLSAFLLVYFCQLHEETSTVSWKMLPLGVVKRWLRLTPTYAIVLAVIATWLPLISTGPFWDKYVTQESESCRRNWWQHLLYINNYVDGSMCMPQTWYLAADTHLYCLGLAIYVFCQSPRSRTLVLSTVFIIGMLLPAIHTYYQDLDGPVLATPSAAMETFKNDRTFKETYMRSHTNLTSCVLGMVTGYLVYSLQKTEFNVDKYKAWRPLYWLLFPMGAAIPLSSKLFYTTPRVGLLYRTLAAAFIKPVFGLLLAIFMIGMVFKVEGVYRGILSWRWWAPLSRVSYCVYLVHFAYIRITYGAMHHPIRISYIRGCEMAVFKVLMVYITATLLWLTIEAPLAQLMKVFFTNNFGSKKTDDVNKNNI